MRRRWIRRFIKRGRIEEINGEGLRKEETEKKKEKLTRKSRVA